MTHIGIVLSKKVVRGFMPEEELLVHYPRSRMYSSYRGEISPKVLNVISCKRSESEVVHRYHGVYPFPMEGGRVYLIDEHRLLRRNAGLLKCRDKSDCGTRQFHVAKRLDDTKTRRSAR